MTLKRIGRIKVVRWFEPLSAVVAVGIALFLVPISRINEVLLNRVEGVFLRKATDKTLIFFLKKKPC